MARDEELKFDASVTAVREANAEFLDYMASALGDGRFRSAAAMLRGQRTGRKPIQDDEALVYAERLLRLGFARSANDAAMQAANLYASSSYRDAVRDRLRRKLRTKLLKSKDSVQPSQ